MRVRTVVALLVLAAASTAHAQGGPGMGMPLDDANFRPTVSMLATMLQLTPEQIRQVTPMRDSLLRATKDQRAEAVQAQTKMQQARRAGVSEDSVTALRTSMQQVMMGMMAARMTFHGQLRAILTETQAATLDAHHEEMMGTMGQGMQGMPAMRH